MSYVEVINGSKEKNAVSFGLNPCQFGISARNSNLQVLLASHQARNICQSLFATTQFVMKRIISSRRNHENGVNQTDRESNNFYNSVIVICTTR